jgi:hypothetical protein
MDDIAIARCLLLSAACDSGVGWQDPSPRRMLLVEGENGIRLEVLDWGGSGRVVLLLAGRGFTANEFDDLRRSVRSATGGIITRRGYAASGDGPSGRQTSPESVRTNTCRLAEGAT